MGEALTIEARHERGYPIVTVAGEIDIATATRLRERLSELAAGGRPLVADLDQVRFIDSAGLAALVGAANRADAHGGSLHVVCARPQIRQLFRLTGLHRRLSPARTLDEALDALMAAPLACTAPPSMTTSRRSADMDADPQDTPRDAGQVPAECCGGTSPSTPRPCNWSPPPSRRRSRPVRLPGRRGPSVPSAGCERLF